MLVYSFDHQDPEIYSKNSGAKEII